jgi:predicted nicotinamide N-methyase
MMPGVVIERVDAGAVGVMLARPEDSDAVFDAAVAEGGDAPYWACLWPSSVALARRVATLSLAGVRVLEVGCGLGLVSLVAAARGGVVLATDAAAEPLRFVQESARVSGLGGVTSRVVDFRDGEPLGRFGLLVAADVLYDEQLTAPLAALIDRSLEPGGAALVACAWDGQAERLVAALAAPATISVESAPGWGEAPARIRIVHATA